MAEAATSVTDQIAELFLTGERLSATEVADKFSVSNTMLYTAKKKLERLGHAFTNEYSDDGQSRWFISNLKTGKAEGAAEATANGSAKPASKRSASKRSSNGSSKRSASNGNGRAAAKTAPKTVAPMLGDSLTVSGLLLDDVTLLRDKTGVEYRAVLTRS